MTFHGGIMQWPITHFSFRFYVGTRSQKSFDLLKTSTLAGKVKRGISKFPMLIDVGQNDVDKIWVTFINIPL